MGMQLLEWFCFVMWPRARNGMYPSLAHIAEGARMSKETAVQAMKQLELFGLLCKLPRPAAEHADVARPMPTRVWDK